MLGVKIKQKLVELDKLNKNNFATLHNVFTVVNYVYKNMEVSRNDKEAVQFYNLHNAHGSTVL